MVGNKGMNITDLRLKFDDRDSVENSFKETFATEYENKTLMIYGVPESSLS